MEEFIISVRGSDISVAKVLRIFGGMSSFGTDFFGLIAESLILTSVTLNWGIEFFS